jgi:choline dehydrogenase-like flavoprotein
VIEYGEIDYSFEAGVPGMVRSVRSQNVLSFSSVPQVGLQNSTQGFTVGAVVGGGSQVNGMTFDRGSKSDYDSWEDLGNPGWGWENLFTYFKKACTTTPTDLPNL